MDFEKIRAAKLAALPDIDDHTDAEEIEFKFAPRDNFDESQFVPLEIRPIKLVTRKEWGAKPPMVPIPAMEALPSPAVTVTYTGRVCNTTEECMSAMRKMQRRHIQRGYPDIKYSFIIGGDGMVYEGRGWDLIPEKNKVYPKLWGFSYEIGLMWYRAKHFLEAPIDPTEPLVIQNFLRKERQLVAPPAKIWRVLEDLIEDGHEQGLIEEQSSFYNANN